MFSWLIEESVRSPVLRWSALISTAVIISGCSHTEPCCDSTLPHYGPFEPNTVPVRLTYSPYSDEWPSFSWDGETISYRYPRRTSDRDLCSAVLPAQGGEHLLTACARGPEQGDTASQINSLVVLDEETIAYTHHRSFHRANGAQEAGLFLTSFDQQLEPELVLSLLTTPPGASARYDALVGPVRTGPREIVALAAQMVVGATVDEGPVDTIYVGVELVRIDLNTRPAGVTPIVNASGANHWAYDHSDGSMHFNKPTYLPPLIEAVFQQIADTVYSVQSTGGSAQPLWGIEHPDPVTIYSLGAVNGLAAGGGKVFISLHQESPSGGPTTTSIAEIDGPDQLRTVTTDQTAAGQQHLWARMSASPDGDRLVAERNSFGVSDLFLFHNP